MSVVGIILLVACVISAVAFVVVRTIKGGVLGVLLKTLASFVFVSTGVVGLVISDSIDVGGLIFDGSAETVKWVLGLIVMGLMHGMIGDILLDLKVIYKGNDKWYLNSGMLTFFCGHICYITAFTLWGDHIFKSQSFGSTWLSMLIAGGVAIALTTVIMLSSKKMGLNFGNFKWQTVAYTLILTFTTVYTLILAICGAGLWITFVAMLLFFLSDIVLSLQYFGGKIDSKPLIVVNHVLYYSAQIILTAVIFVL